MDIYLIRHADALALGEGGTTDDADRPLSDEGRDQAKRLAAALQRHDIRLGVLLTSPLLRARQTAEGMLKEWPAPAPRLEVCDQLAPGGKRKKLSRQLTQLGGNAVGLVGHMPDLGEYLAWLIGTKKGLIEMAKAGVAYVRSSDEVRKASGTLEWLVTPEWLG